jgi:hypothetical protein
VVCVRRIHPDVVLECRVVLLGRGVVSPAGLVVVGARWGRLRSRR